MGNCHVHQIAEAFTIATDLKSSVVRDPGDIKNGSVLYADTLQKVQRSERIAVLSTFKDIFISAFPDAKEKIFVIPHIISWSFHPDIIEFLVDGKRFQTAMGVSNSALVLYSYIKQLTEEEAKTLFDRDIYSELGYKSKWKKDIAWARRQEELTTWPVVEFYKRWREAGSFVHTPNHPKLSVLADIAIEFARRCEYVVKIENPTDFMLDKGSRSAIWPVYPGLLENGSMGDIFFKIDETSDLYKETGKRTLSLNDFISYSYKCYSNLDNKCLPCDQLKKYELEKLDEFLMQRKHKKAAWNPYSNLTDAAFWRRSISSVSMEDVDPVYNPKFKINRTTSVATSGSCFAQHISNYLSQSGCNYLITEKSPVKMPKDEAISKNYGVYSTRSGNIYTTRQLVQLFDRAYGYFSPARDFLKGHKGEYIDTFRPQIQPLGFPSHQALLADRTKHLCAVREMFETCEVLVFTLGLTEGWCDKTDGSVFPVFPGAVSPDLGQDNVEFFNLTVEEIQADLINFREKLQSVNPSVRIILTVSPVPLIATFERRNVLVSTTYSKSALRVAADFMDRMYEDVMYFPSFEIITGSFNRGTYFDDDLRSVKTEGVNHVMRLFMKHCVAMDDSVDLSEALESARIVCDEEIMGR